MGAFVSSQLQCCRLPCLLTVQQAHVRLPVLVLACRAVFSAIHSHLLQATHA